MIFLRILITGFFSGSIGFSGAKSILIPVKIKNTPKKITTAWYCISTAPKAIKIARKTRAPKIPKNKTRCW
ncbi:hypothetical protein D3C72_1488400 [compost metagenome]